MSVTKSLPDANAIQRDITTDLIEDFSEVSGDENPLHMNEDYAEDGLFGGRIAHGMLSGAFISAALAGLAEDRDVIYLKQEMTFTAPVFPGETLTTTAEPTMIDDEGNVVVKTIVKNGKSEIVVTGEATVQIQ